MKQTNTGPKVLLRIRKTLKRFDLRPYRPALDDDEDLEGAWQEMLDSLDDRAEREQRLADLEAMLNRLRF